MGSLGKLSYINKPQDGDKGLKKLFEGKFFLCNSNYNDVPITSVRFLLKYADHRQKGAGTVSRHTPKSICCTSAFLHADVTHLIQSSCRSHELAKRVAHHLI